MLAETLTRVDDSSRKNVCSDKTMHKCLFSSVRNTEDQLFLRSLFYYPRHLPHTLHAPSDTLSSYTLSWYQTWTRPSLQSCLNLQV